MSTPRTTATELGKLLNSAKQPIYVLDDDLTIIYINRACQEWLGDGAETLVGRRCAYHSSPAVGGPEAVAAGLCPPPRVLSGDIVSATVSRRVEDGTLDERPARFLPLETAADGLIGVVVLVDLAGQPSSDADSLRDDGSSEATALHEAVRRFRQEAASRYRADRLIGRGPAMRLARRQVELAAAGRSSVLLVGPPGSGRQHLAAAIHYGAMDKAAVGALTPVDCSLLGEDLLETLAAASIRGTKTLLLHRVDELAADVQVQLADHLLRKPPPWRVIATAAASLSALARRGGFRPDLAAFLSTIVIELPALAGRRDDLPLLAQLFLEDCNATGRRQIGGFSSAALDRLDAYDWPGNLDELAQVVDEAHRCAGGPEIGVGDLPERLHIAARAAAVPRRADETIVLDEYLGRIERELIRRALAHAKGNKAKAARLLGVTRPRLYRRMVQLGMEGRRERRGERGEGHNKSIDVQRAGLPAVCIIFVDVRYPFVRARALHRRESTTPRPRGRK